MRLKLQIKSLIVGFLLAYLIPLSLFAALWFLEGGQPAFRDQKLASGKTIKVASFRLVWGVEHDERDTQADSLALEYVSSAAHADMTALDRETLEVFELIRPVSEQWGFGRASVSVFPTTERKGKYHIYSFSRGSDGSWKFDREQAKVFADD